MRWKHTKIRIPKHKEQRTIQKFLWFPLTLNDETRWLELAKIRQEFVEEGYTLPSHWLDMGFHDYEGQMFESIFDMIDRDLTRRLNLSNPPRGGSGGAYAGASGENGFKDV